MMEVVVTIGAVRRTKLPPVLSSQNRVDLSMVGGERRNTKGNCWGNGHVQFVVNVWAQTRCSALIVNDGCIRDVVVVV